MYSAPRGFADEQVSHSALRTTRPKSSRRRGDYDRLPVEHRRKELDLPFSVEHEVAGMYHSLVQRGLPVIHCLVVRLSCNPVVLDTCMNPRSSVYEGLHVVEVEVEPNVSIEVSVVSLDLHLHSIPASTIRRRVRTQRLLLGSRWGRRPRTWVWGTHAGHRVCLLLCI